MRFKKFCERGMCDQSGMSLMCECDKHKNKVYKAEKKLKIKK